MLGFAFAMFVLPAGIVLAALLLAVWLGRRSR